MIKGFQDRRIRIYEWFFEILKNISWSDKTLGKRYLEKLLVVRNPVIGLSGTKFAKFRKTIHRFGFHDPENLWSNFIEYQRFLQITFPLGYANTETKSKTKTNTSTSIRYWYCYIPSWGWGWRWGCGWGCERQCDDIILNSILHLLPWNPDPQA